MKINLIFPCTLLLAISMAVAFLNLAHAVPPAGPVVTAPATLPATQPGRGVGRGRGTAPSPAAAKQPAVAMTKTFIDFFKPLPVSEPLSKEVWGAAAVGPREQITGLEDKGAKEFSYWDGQLIKAKDGKHHLFASRWP